MNKQEWIKLLEERMDFLVSEMEALRTHGALAVPGEILKQLASIDTDLCNIIPEYRSECQPQT